MTRAGRHLLGAAALGCCAVALAACSTGITTASYTVTPTTSAGVTLASEPSPVGRILATPSGHTLYDFSPDTPTSSACTRGLCVRLWPPLLVTGAPTVGKGLRTALVGTVRRPGGALQVTYGGHPLYTWIGDNKPGMVTGQALLNVGGYWYVITASGRQVTTPFRVTQTQIRR